MLWGGTYARDKSDRLVSLAMHPNFLIFFLTCPSFFLRHLTAIAFPGKEEPPIVIDMATSVIAYGKVEDAQRLGKHVPEGMLIDKHGDPTTSPECGCLPA